MVSALTRIRAIRCSTPEGIEAGRTSGPGMSSTSRTVVLNARGHRGGKNGHSETGRSCLGVVLNARGHRGGKNIGKPSGSSRLRLCSTPEGIEAGRTRLDGPRARGGRRVLNARGHRGGKNDAPGERAARHDLVLNARGHRGGKNSRDRRYLRSSGQVLNARGHRGGKNPSPVAPRTAALPVLNARGHRGGKNIEGGSEFHAGCWCSTPEGIEAGRTGSLRGISRGLGRCSTPEGIEAGRTRGRRHVLPALVEVLNARGHRGGKNRPAVGREGVGHVCSTPEGIEAGRTSQNSRCSLRKKGAQRPRATRREERYGAGHGAARGLVLNARGHRGGKNPPLGQLNPGSPVCSTPEGIEAGRTAGRVGADNQQSGAQRPRASRREEPGCPP